MRLFKKKKRRVKESEPAPSSSPRRSGGRFRMSSLSDKVFDLLRYWKYILLFFVLLVLYINNRYTSELMMRRVVQLEEALQHKKYEWLTISDELVRESRRSVVEEELKRRGIKLMPLKEPAIKIEE